MKTSNTFLRIPAPLNQQIVTWTVAAITDEGQREWAPERTFTFGSIPVTPSPEPTPVESEFCEGDANGDGFVNLSDYIAVRNNFGAVNPEVGDATGDGFVNLFDYIAVRENFGRVCP